MLRHTILLLLAVVSSLAVACAPSQFSPAAPTAPAQTGGTGPAQTPAASEWDVVLQAAKREGTVSVIGPTGTPARDALTGPFEAKYGIKVDYLAEAGPSVPPKVQTERAAGQYRYDVFIGGTTTGVLGLGALQALDPLEPSLILAEVKDPKNWRGGALEFVDDARQMLVMSPFQRAIIFVNSNQVRPDEFTTHKDLLDPKWKGRLVIDDPRKAGSGQGTFLFYYLHPELGPDFIRALARQEPVILRDYQQEADVVGQGRYPVLVGGDDYIVGARIDQGIPITMIEPRLLRERTDIAPANGAVGVFNNAPHPAAAKVYVNWLLSQDGQTTFVKAMGYVSNRLDVPTDHVPGWRVPLPDGLRTYTLDALRAREQANAFFEEVFGSGR
jgi:ABC-type Fe3+ transport system substrate-binding protein